MRERIEAAFEAMLWWHEFLLILGVSVAIAMGIKVAGIKLLRQVETEEPTYHRLLLRELPTLLYRSVLFLGLFAAAQLLATQWVVFTLSAVALSGLILQWSWSVVNLGLGTFEIVSDGERVSAIGPWVKNLWKMVVFVIAFFIVLSIWDVDVTPALASAGIIGIIVAVAAQGTLSNVFAGIALSFDRTYKIGDVISLRSGERGTVIDISMRSTTLLTRDNITITVPNSNLNDQRIVNESAPHKMRRIRLPIGVAYDSDLEQVEDVLLGLVDDVKFVMKDPAPEVKYREFGDSAIQLEYRCHIRNPILLGSAIDALIREVKIRFDEAGITIPFPQRTHSYLETNGADTDRVVEELHSPSRVPDGTTGDGHED